MNLSSHVVEQPTLYIEAYFDTHTAAASVYAQGTYVNLTDTIRRDNSISKENEKCWLFHWVH